MLIDMQKEMAIMTMDSKSNIVFNVSGGQVNIAKDNGRIVATQNNDCEGNREDGRNSEEWMLIIQKWCEYIDIDNWEVWTSYLLGSGLPRLRVDRADKLDELRQWILRRVWPKGCDEVRESLLNFYAVLNDFINLFHEHSENKGTVYLTDKFYHINQWDTELYDKLLLEFRNHVNLVNDMVLEMTRAANYVCDMVRQYIAPEFRIKEGMLVVVTGPNMELAYDTLRPEYRGEDRKTHAPYKGLEQFKKDRYNRDFYWGQAE